MKRTIGSLDGPTPRTLVLLAPFVFTLLTYAPVVRKSHFVVAFNFHEYFFILMWLCLIQYLIFSCWLSNRFSLEKLALLQVFSFYGSIVIAYWVEVMLYALCCGRHFPTFDITSILLALFIAPLFLRLFPAILGLLAIWGAILAYQRWLGARSNLP